MKGIVYFSSLCINKSLCTNTYYKHTLSLKFAGVNFTLLSSTSETGFPWVHPSTTVNSFTL